MLPHNQPKAADLAKSSWETHFFFIFYFSSGSQGEENLSQHAPGRRQREKKQKKTDWLNGRLATFPGCFMDADALSTTMLSKKTTWLAWLWTEIYTNMEPVVPKHRAHQRQTHPSMIWSTVTAQVRFGWMGRKSCFCQYMRLVEKFPYTVYLVNKSLFVDMWVGLTVKILTQLRAGKHEIVCCTTGEKYRCNSTIENRQ